MARDEVLMMLGQQNIIVNAAGRACLSDIGFTSETSDADGTETGAHGSRWTAPEIFKHGEFSKQSDVFSFGFVAADVCTRNPTSHYRN